ncbi:MAG TPA: phage head closure protein [Rhizomicrobium sp.]|jgi:SPP1 family predicted phage head-tail adaptor
MLSSLNQRGVIEAQTLTPDGAGGYSASWTTVANAWVSLEPMSGAEMFGPDASESRVRHRIVLRRLDGIAAGMRVKIGARAFLIRALLDDGPQSQFLRLMTEEIG